MTDFSTINSTFDRVQRGDLCKFCNTYSKGDEAIRYLLIRSLDSAHIKELLPRFSVNTTSRKLSSLWESLYNTSITIDDLLSFIEGKRPELLKQREEELDGLSDLLKNFPIQSCGVRNDNISDLVKDFARNKSLKSMDALYNTLDTDLLPRIRQYSLWSYYNQTSNDFIELSILKNPITVPTLRKIPDVDFFLKFDNKLIPFDIKYTQISDDYFDMASQGIKKSKNSGDDYIVDSNNSSSEITRLKEYYKAFKRKHPEYNLPNIGQSRSKSKLCDNLIKTNNSEALKFVSEIKKEHANYVPSSNDQSNLKQLEWWNYKNQGERLFCNNNRLYIFLAYNHEFTDGRLLKGKINDISNKIDELLNNITKNNIHKINYHYDKDKTKEGNYSALSMSTIYSE